MSDHMTPDPSTSATPQPADEMKHSLFEDALAIVHATLFIALGITLYKHVGLLTGGTVGVAFQIHYLSGFDFSTIFFVLNLPFYWIAWHKMGHEFTIKTFCAVALLSLWTRWMPDWLELKHVDPIFAAIIGGLLIGGGFLFMIRHKASLGGVGIVAFYLQQTRGWRAGKLQMGFDVCIIALSFLIAPAQLVVYSILGAVTMNLVLAVNHRQGRYLGM